MLTKGPLGLFLPCVVIVILTIQKFDFKSLFYLIKPQWIISLALPGVWYYLAYLSYGEGFLEKQLYFENVNRLLGGEGISKKPWWFYLIHLGTQAFPWIFSALFVVFAYSSRFRQLYKKDDSIKTFLTWFVTIIFFSFT